MTNPDFRALCAEKIKPALMSVSGGLCSFSAEAKHLYLLDVQKNLKDIEVALSAAPQQGAPTVTDDDFRRWWKETNHPDIKTASGFTKLLTPDMLLAATAFANYCLTRHGAQAAPPTLKEQALSLIDDYEDYLKELGSNSVLDLDLIRRALESDS